MSYEITLTIRNDANAGTTDAQYVQIVGAAGQSSELECQANFNVLNQDVTCTVKSPLLPHYTCVKWRNSGGNSLEFTQVSCFIVR